MPTIYPSLEAFDAAVHGKQIKRSDADPLGVFVDKTPGFWFDGRIQHDGTGKPLPCIVEVKERIAARKLAAAGGRPLPDGDPRLIDMLREFYGATGAPTPPAVVAALIAPPPAKAKG